VNHEALTFPCLAIGERGIWTMAWKTVVATRLMLKHRYYDGLRIVDSSGSEYAVKSATRLRGYGPFGGWNLFFNQRVSVRLQVEPTGKTFTVEELRAIVRTDFKSWHGWESRVGIEETKREIAAAGSCAEILHALTRHEPPEPPSAR
jgi:hypothetical protein